MVKDSSSGTRYQALESVETGFPSPKYSECPHKHHHHRFCGGRLSGTACALVVTITVFLVLIATGLYLVYGFGHKYAETAIDDSDITFSMKITRVYEDAFDVDIVGGIDNRNVLKATLDPTVIHLSYGKRLPFGAMAFPSIELGGGVTTPLNLSLRVEVTNQDSFDEFASALLTAPSIDMHLASSVTVKALGIKYHNIPFRKVVFMDAFNGFVNPPISVTNQEIHTGLPNTLINSIDVTMYNPTKISFDSLGLVNLTVHVGAEQVGYALSRGNFSVPFADASQNGHTTAWDVHLVRTPQNSNGIDRVLSDFASGAVLDVVLRGQPKYSTNIPLLEKAMADVSIPAKLPGLVHLEDKLIQLVYSFLNGTAIQSSNDPTQCGFTNNPPIKTEYTDVYMYAHNPFSAEITLDSVDLNVVWHPPPSGGQPSSPVFMAAARSSNLGLKIPPKGTAVQVQRLCLADNPELLIQIGLFALEHGSKLKGIIPIQLDTSINGTIVGHLEEFPAPLEYYQLFTTVTQVLTTGL